jgi:type III pantothenate kinase
LDIFGKKSPLFSINTILNTTTLCFDFGNTRLKCGVFNNASLREVVSLADGSPGTIEALLTKYAPVKTILSSVIDHDAAIESLLAAKTSYHKLSAQTILPFTTPVGKPETIGTDRLALAAAAVYFHPGKNNLVIALGSCVTYNFINKYNMFIGGGISPGLEMRFKSLHTFTAKLPLTQPDLVAEWWNFPLIGYDTRTNILSGVLMGLAAELDGIIESYHEKFNNINVVLTGGDVPYFARHLKNRIFTEPDFLFKGLYAISQANYAT